MVLCITSAFYIVYPDVLSAITQVLNVVCLCSWF